MANLVYRALRKIAPPILRYSAVPIMKGIHNNSATIISFHDYESSLLFSCLLKLKKNYNIVPLSKMIDDLYENRLDSRSVAITLDDGILIQVRTIAHILDQLEIPATFFVCPEYLDSDHIYWWEEVRLLLNMTQKNVIHFKGQSFPVHNKSDRFASFKKINKLFFSRTEDDIKILLNELYKECGMQRKDLPVHHSIRIAKIEDILRLVKSDLFEIGSHSMDHPWLALQSIEEMEYQIGGSKQRLELMFGKISNCFCYPYGPLESINEQTLKLTKKYYEAGVTAQYGRIYAGDDPMKLRRVALMPGENYSVWEAKINGTWKQVGQYF